MAELLSLRGMHPSPTFAEASAFTKVTVDRSAGGDAPACRQAGSQQKHLISLDIFVLLQIGFEL
ncbi:hypothetical protein HY411_01960 [Candidatus Gottesmanbacteria bacterium]|nr:hypothetical protein [Candidatus Gottesmanbacteria bacterium]